MGPWNNKMKFHPISMSSLNRSPRLERKLNSRLHHHQRVLFKHWTYTLFNSNTDLSVLLSMLCLRLGSGGGGGPLFTSVPLLPPLGSVIPEVPLSVPVTFWPHPGCLSVLPSPLPATVVVSVPCPRVPVFFSRPRSLPAFPFFPLCIGHF